jgi:hypothetical protein
MATAVVTAVEQDPGENLLAGVQVSATLYPPGLLCYGPGGQLLEYITQSTVSNSSGAWSLTLERTDTIAPAGMVYLVTRSMGGVIFPPVSITVPSGGGVFQDLWTSTPGPVPPGSGPTGPPGSFALEGAWSSTTPYLEGALVTYEGTLYLCSNANTDEIPTNTAYWDAFGGANLVDSVNSQTGAVVLTASEVGADASGAAATAQSTAESFATSAVGTETSRAETAEGLLAPKASPALTGVPTAPTAAALTSTTQLATTAFATTALALKADLVSGTVPISELPTSTAPSLRATSGVPTITSTDDAGDFAWDEAATTMYGPLGGTLTVSTLWTASPATCPVNALAPTASPTFTGTPTAPTQSALTNNTDLATTAYADSAVAAMLTATDTLTNKRITKRVLALSANSATPAINTDSHDVVHITAQTAAITSFTSGLTGTPVDGDTLRISITGTAAVGLTWGASFESSTVTLPATTVGTSRLDIGFFWHTATSAWRCMAVA